METTMLSIIGELVKTVLDYKGERFIFLFNVSNKTIAGQVGWKTKSPFDVKIKNGRTKKCDIILSSSIGEIRNLGGSVRGLKLIHGGKDFIFILVFSKKVIITSGWQISENPLEMKREQELDNKSNPLPNGN